jgi:parallel beta-helix repeat protein
MKKKLILAMLCIPLFPLYAVPLTMLSPSQILNGPVIIANSGLYVLSDDVEGVVSSAITITTSDVTLDLNGKTLRGANTSVVGIGIAGAFENIVVKNGSIIGFITRGISVQQGARSLTFENLIISGTTQDSLSTVGIVFGNVGSTIRTSNIYMRNCHVNANSQGLGATATDDVVMENCTFNQNGQGIAVINCNNWLLQKCQASGNTSASGANNSATFGLTTNAASNWHVLNSDFSFNSNVNRGAGGFIGLSNTFVFENCTFNNNGATGSAASLAFGLGLNTTFSSVVRNCIANGNFAVTTTASGFAFTGNGFGNLAENCVAIGNNVTSTSFNAYGFLIGNVQPHPDAVLIKCTAQANSSQALGIGFFISSGSTNCVIKDSLSFSNTHTGFSIAVPTAFLTGNLAMGNPTPYVGTFGSINVPYGTQPVSTAFDTRMIDNISVS